MGTKGTTVALVNNKGGVGKTTVAVNLSCWLAIKGYKILLVDIDSQASASLSLGFTGSSEGENIADIMFNGRPIADIIKNTKITNLDIVVSHRDISTFDQQFSSTDDRNIKLKQQISKIRDRYDYIFIDSPPSLSLLTINALGTADRLIIPVTPDYLSLEGLGLLMNLIDPKEQYRILLSMVDNRLRITEEVITFIRKQFKDKVFHTEINQNVRLKEAPSYGQSIFNYALYSTGAKCFIKLGKEFLQWLD